MKLSDAEIMKLRSLGYNQKEIAKRLHLTQVTVSNRLSKIRKQAEKEGEDEVFLDLCLRVYIPKILRYLNVR